ncbi:MAG TPA: lysophospholipid acyltransferase family protein [Pyrinomonadaceae bacterium]|nr:lysophospholipid acyltransferase family protein [Pyrinomonadaceae bacterium]
MSLISSSIEPSNQRNGGRSYPRMLPEWALYACRPVVGGLSRLLWRIRWVNTEYIPNAGGLIIASNHQSYIDPFWVARPVKRPVRFLAWDEAFDWPVVGAGLRGFGAWPLQLEGSDPAAIRLSLQWLREGGAMVIFPEGGRGNPDGSMRKFKAGAARMALEAGVPILPVTIRGGNRVWPSSQRFPRLGSVEVIYHPLLVIEQREGEEVRGCARRETERLAEIVRSAL